MYKFQQLISSIKQKYIKYPNDCNYLIYGEMVKVKAFSKPSPTQLSAAFDK